MIVYKVGNKWFLWDEKRVVSFGPFLTRNEAEKLLDKIEKKCSEFCKNRS